VELVIEPSRVITGANQGYNGTLGSKDFLFGVIEYKAGDLIDQVIEAFGGSHDYMGGQAVGSYDDKGNKKRGMSGIENGTRGQVSVVALVPAAPLAMADLISPEMWHGINVLLKSGQ